MEERHKGSRLWATIGVIALALPAFYLGGAPLFALGIKKLMPSKLDAAQFVFKPAQLVYDRFGIYQNYVDFVLDD